jgi:DNA-binding transcriptional MerR regulator
MVATRLPAPPLGGTPAMSEQLTTTTAHTVPAPRPERGGDRFYMTGDLRALTGLPRTHIDFYLREGIIQPTLRTGSGYLLFDERELETLRTVLRWRAEGVAIREIRDRLGRPTAQ